MHHRTPTTQLRQALPLHCMLAGTQTERQSWWGDPSDFAHAKIGGTLIPSTSWHCWCHKDTLWYFDLEPATSVITQQRTRHRTLMKMPLSPLSPGSGAQLPIRAWIPWERTPRCDDEVMHPWTPVKFVMSSNDSNVSIHFDSRFQTIPSKAQGTKISVSVSWGGSGGCSGIRGQMQYSASTSRKWWNQMMYVGCCWKLIRNWCSAVGLCNFAFAPSSATASAAASSPPSCGVRHDPSRSKSYQTPITFHVTSTKRPQQEWEPICPSYQTCTSESECIHPIRSKSI